MHSACAILRCHLWPVRLYNIFQHYLMIGRIFWGVGVGIIEYKMCVLILYTILSEIILILRRTERDMIKMYIGLHVKYRLLLSDFDEAWIFSTDLWKNTQVSNFIKNMSSGSRDVPWERTDMTKLTVALLNFANAPRISTFCPHSVFMCFEWISEQTAIISLYNINWLVFIVEI